MATRKRFDVEIPDGQHLGFSRDTDGAYRAHLFDNATNDLVGHAELFEPEEGVDSSDEWHTYSSDSSTRDHEFQLDEETTKQLEELGELLGELVVLGIIAAAKTAAPHLKKWWNSHVIPAIASAPGKIKSARSRAIRRRKAHHPEPVPENGLLLADPAPDFRRVDDVLEALKVKMSSAEARERLAAALIAREFYDEQMRLLCNARIVDDRETLELASAMKALTPDQVGDTIKLMLERDPSLLNRETLNEVGKLLGSRRDGSAHTSFVSETVRKVLDPAPIEPKSQRESPSSGSSVK